MTAIKPRHLPEIILAALIIACCLWLRTGNVYRVGTVADEGVFVALAEQMSQGKVLYHDLFIDHPPGLLLTLSGLFRLFGADLIYPRLLMACFSGLTCLSVLLIGWRSFNPAMGLLAALFFALDPLNLFWSKFVFSEPFYSLLETLSILLVIPAFQKPRPYLLVAGGLAAGLAFQVKQTGGLVMAAIAGLILWEVLLRLRSGRDRRAALIYGGRSLALVVCGFLLPFVGVLLYILSAPPDTPGRYFTSVYALNLPTPTDLAQKLSVTWTYLLRRPTVILALASAPLILAVKRDAASWLLLLWGLAEYALFLLLPYLRYDFGGFSHYVVPTAAPTALLAALLLGHFWQKAAGHLPDLRRASGAAWPGLVAMLVGAAALPGFAADFNQAMNSPYPNPGFDQEKAIGDYVQSITSPDEHILVFTNSIFYHRARREPAGRFIFYSNRLLETPIRNEMLYELSQEMQDARTKAILVSTPFVYNSDVGPISQLASLLYEQVSQFPYDYQDQVLILRRRPQATAPYIAPLPPSFAAPQELPIQRRREARLGDEVTLLGYSRDVEQVEAGKQATLTLFWRGESAMSRDYTIFVHLTDDRGQRVAQADHQVYDGLYPTSTWQRGEVIQDRFWLTVPVGVEPGEYHLQVGMYDAATSQRLSAMDGDAIDLDTLTVVARSVSDEQ